MQIVTLPLTDAIVRRWEQAITDGYGDDDVDVVIAVATAGPDRDAIAAGNGRS